DGDATPADQGRGAPRANRRAQGGLPIAAGQPPDFFFLTDGGQDATAVAPRLATFLAGSTKTVDVSIYDLRLESGPGDIHCNAFQGLVQRGFAIRLMFNQDHAKEIPVPPPPEIDWAFIDRLRS